MRRMPPALPVLLTLTCLTAASTGFAQQITTDGPVTRISITHETQSAGVPHAIDFEHAKALPLPTPGFAASSLMEAAQSRPALPPGRPGFSPGSPGDGQQRPIQLVQPEHLAAAESVPMPQEFGTSGQPFTTNRVNALGDNTQFYYAYRPTGKLFFNIGTQTYVCSASLIKPGVVVTAGHCAANFGHSQFYSNWTFVPAYSNGTAPYGTWTVASATVLTSYYNGTDSCSTAGVVCQDDVALLALNPQNGSYAGSHAGWYAYGWNGYGFNSSSQALINQLGYPVALDGGNLMQRNDSQGYVASSSSNNTIIGSLMTGGSSGGPWTVNLGIAPTLVGTNFGNASQRNVVVGVTSWGYTDTTIKQQGASPFTSNNIVVLVNTVCAAHPGAC